METFTPTPALAASYAAPQDGVDTVSVTTIRPWLEGLSNLAARFRQLVIPTTPTAFTRVIQAPGVSVAGPVIPSILNHTIPANGTIRMPLGELPSGCVLNAIRIRIDPANNTLPAGTKVRLSLVQRTVNTATEVAVAGLTDPLTGASYQAAHDLTLSPGVTIDYTGQVYAVISGETGTDADDALLLEVEVTYTVSQIDLGR